MHSSLPPQSAEKVPVAGKCGFTLVCLAVAPLRPAACRLGFFSAAASLALRATYIASRLRQQSSHMPVLFLVLPPHFQVQFFIGTPALE
jgi:hypothetical protein